MPGNVDLHPVSSAYRSSRARTPMQLVVARFREAPGRVDRAELDDAAHTASAAGHNARSS